MSRTLNLGHATRRLLELLDLYGAGPLDAAIAEALERGAPHVAAVRQVLERESAGKKPALPLPLGNDPRIRELTVRPHALETYDSLTRNRFAKETDHDDDASAEPALVGA